MMTDARVASIAALEGTATEKKLALELLDIRAERHLWRCTMIEVVKHARSKGDLDIEQIAMSVIADIGGPRG